jgi:hypothetical protein
MKYKFGDKGIWCKSYGADGETKNISVVVLEEQQNGTLHIFITDLKDTPLTHRIATIFSTDFTLTSK